MDIMGNTLSVTQGMVVILFVNFFALLFSTGAGMIARYFWDLFPHPLKKNESTNEK